jgi:hypothetical protein
MYLAGKETARALTGPTFLLTVVVMADPRRVRMQALLAAEASPLRTELLRMGFAALASQPVAVVLADPELPSIVYRALALESVERITRRHVLPGVLRVQGRLGKAHETVQDLLSPDAEKALRALIDAGKGPRFKWLAGAIDPADMQRLLSPVVQQVLTNFASKLPIPGVQGGGSGSTPPPSGKGTSLVGLIGKQVSRSASQLAEVGKSVMGGLGSELERRMQALARDFSQGAVGEVRAAVIDRLRSEEGREITGRIRKRILERVLMTEVHVIVDDVLRLPLDQVGRVAEGAVAHTAGTGLFRDALQAELKAVLDEIGQRTLADLLAEAGLLEGVEGLAIRATEPGLVALFRSEPFGDFLDRLLAASSEG